MQPETSTLYTFRRCPYAIRARHAIAYSEIKVEYVEVSLKNKPAALLMASSKGTVPILVLPNGKVIDESRDIMLWALSKRDPEGWYYSLSNGTQEEINNLIDRCDNDFKVLLDRYKYSDRFPEKTTEDYRNACEAYLACLNERLALEGRLIGSRTTLADIAILPFVRQFSRVDPFYFENCRLHYLRKWLNCFLESKTFINVMKKRHLPANLQT